MKKLGYVVLLGAQALAYNAAADSLADLTIASDMAALDLTQIEEPRGRLWSFGVARNDDHRATTASISYNAIGRLDAAPGVLAGLGWKASYHNTFQSSFSLALGGSIRYEPANLKNVGFEGQAYLAPDVLATNDSERYQELMVRATYDLHSRATVFAGWADKTLRYEGDADVAIVDGFIAGFSLTF